MKVLLINKFHFVQGGADRHYLELADLLKSQGHEVIFFSMHHSKNLSCDQSKYFVDYLDFSKVKIDRHIFKKIGRMFWSKEAQRKLDQLIQVAKPDIAHMHNIYHQISPSIIKTLKKNNIPIIMTVHDYYLVSPLYSLFAKNKVFDPQKWQYWRIVLHRAIKGSFNASALSSLVNWWHKYRGYYEDVDLFICPSNFLAIRLQQSYPSIRIEVLPNFAKQPKEHSVVRADYYLYAGRIIDEKGVDLIMQSAQKLPEVSFQIAGTGPNEDSLRAHYDLPNVNWLGRLDSKSLRNKIQSARAVIVPSRWYENCPLAILESFALGTPVIASRIGGIPELIRHEYNGLLFNNDSADDLSKQIEMVNNNDDFYRIMAMGAKESARKYDPLEYYDKLLKLYESI